MNGFMAFFKKECIENMKNHRLFILFTLFLIFGITNAPIAKYTPDILAALAENIQITLKPSAINSWEQFFKNISGVGFSVVIILFGSCLSHEYTSGTIVLMVTKGLPRSIVVMVKFLVSVLIMSLCFWTCFILTYGYTIYIWPSSSLSNLLEAATLLWLEGILYLSILILGCVCFKQTFSSILFTGSIVALLSLMKHVECLLAVTPVRLSAENVSIILGTVTMSDLYVPIILTLFGIGVSLLLAVVIFDKKIL